MSDKLFEGIFVTNLGFFREMLIQIVNSLLLQENSYKIVRTLRPLIEETSSKKKCGKGEGAQGRCFHFESEFCMKITGGTGGTEQSGSGREMSIVQRLCEIRNVLIEKIGADMISMHHVPVFTHSDRLLQSIRLVSSSSLSLVSIMQLTFLHLIIGFNIALIIFLCKLE